MKLDQNYAAMMLTEILYEQKLINKEILQAVYEKVKAAPANASAA